MSTPVRSQYLAMKKRLPDAILFFRLGDFYETFDDDAKIVSEVCDIVLTSRPVGKGERVPLAGVPYHSAEGYIAKLIAAGYKVAIAEQQGNEPVRGLVPRSVVRVVTPGTLVEPSLVPARQNNYLVSVWHEKDASALSYVDITTGDLATTQFPDDEDASRLRSEIARLQPAEVLFPSNNDAPPSWAFLEGARLSPYPSWRFDVEGATNILKEHFEVATLDGFGLGKMPLAVRTSGALLQYLQETQPTALKQLTEIRTYSIESFVILDEATRRNLEITMPIRGDGPEGSLLWVLDSTVTPMGGRMLRRWLSQPLLDASAIERRLDAVQAWVEHPRERMEMTTILKKIGDLERWTRRAVQGLAMPREVVGIREALSRLPEVQRLTEQVFGTGSSEAKSVAPVEDLLHLLEQAIADEPPATLNAGGVIRSGYSEDLDGIIQAARDAKAWVANLEQHERERTGIKNLRVGYNKVFGYYIEVTKANIHLVPGNYIRKQTLVNAERYITPELKEREALILGAQERMLELEQRLYREVLARVAEHAPTLRGVSGTVAYLDVTAALADVAVRNVYVRPEIADDQVLDIKGGRHPVVERCLDEPFVPNDLLLTPENAIMILTGPNMSGKSTFLRQAAIITLMAQIGSFVPAERAHIGLVDRIFTRIGAADEIHRGQSTFMVEMVELSNILHHATPRSLLILDEVGRGTSTYDGLAIAWAAVEYIHNHPDLRARTLFATHYHELIDLAEQLPHVVNYNVAVAEEGENVVFLHKVVPGGADKSYGIHVARLAGLPRQVIVRAQEILDGLEKRSYEQKRRVPSRRPVQLPLFTLEHPVLEEIKEIDVNSMTPLDALNKLYQIQKRLKEE